MTEWYAKPRARLVRGQGYGRIRAGVRVRAGVRFREGVKVRRPRS